MRRGVARASDRAGKLLRLSFLTGLLAGLPLGVAAQPVPQSAPPGATGTLKLPAVVPMPPLPPLPRTAAPQLSAPVNIAPGAKAGSTAAVPPPPQSGAPNIGPATKQGSAATLPPPPQSGAPATAGAPGGFSPAQRATVERINTYFNSVSTLIGNFVQIGPDGSRTEGDFWMQKPGKVRFDYDPPSPIELIADGSAVAVRDRKLATQDIYPLSQTPLRFLLAEKIDLLKDASVVGVYQDPLFITVTIEEKHPVVGTHRLMIMFGAEDSQLKQWTVTDPQGYDTTVAVFNLDPTQKPDPRLFRINYERMLQ